MNKIEIQNKIDALKKEILQLEEQQKQLHIYEHIQIIKTTATIQEVEQIKINVQDILKNYKMEILGIKKLAYDIKGQKEGFYILLNFEGSESDVVNLESYLRENDNILKFITILKDEDEEE